MRDTKLAVIVLLNLLVGTSLSPARIDDESGQDWRPLPLIKDGRVDPGWTHIGWGGFVVEGSALRTECDTKGMGLLVYSKERFGNCQIRVVYRSKDLTSNAGVFVRIDNGILKADKPAPVARNNEGKLADGEVEKLIDASERGQGPWYAVHHGYEVQICDDADETHRTGAIYSLAKAAPVPKKQPGDWNTMVITLKGNLISVDVNGKRISAFDPEGNDVPASRKWFEPKREPKRPVSGYIGLQNHDPGDVVYFKEISVRSLDNAATPAEQYEALRTEHEAIPDDFAAATTDDDRRKVGSRLSTLPPRFLALAEKYPQHPVAIESLIRTVEIVNGTAFPAGHKDSPGSRALTILERDHLRSERLGRVCQQVAFGFHQSHESLLRAILEKNPHRDVQGLACLSLAQFLSNRSQRLDGLRDLGRTDEVERYHRVFGTEFIDSLLRQDRTKIDAEVESLFARAAEQYADVNIPVVFAGSGGVVGAKAESELFKIRHLAIGKPAPDIDGEDQDGKRFRLTDYRGKVVLLHFWDQN
jgi:hypothetical protein